MYNLLSTICNPCTISYVYTGTMCKLYINNKLKDFERLECIRYPDKIYFRYIPDKTKCIFYWLRSHNTGYLDNSFYLLTNFKWDTENQRRISHSSDVGYNVLSGNIFYYYHNRFEGIHINVWEFKMDILYLDNDNIIGKYLKQSGILDKVN